jgi:hypothetical protein
MAAFLVKFLFLKEKPDDYDENKMFKEFGNKKISQRNILFPDNAYFGIRSDVTGDYYSNGQIFEKKWLHTISM